MISKKNTSPSRSYYQLVMLAHQQPREEGPALACMPMFGSIRLWYTAAGSVLPIPFIPSPAVPICRDAARRGTWWPSTRHSSGQAPSRSRPARRLQQQQRSPPPPTSREQATGPCPVAGASPMVKIQKFRNINPIGTELICCSGASFSSVYIYACDCFFGNIFTFTIITNFT